MKSNKELAGIITQWINENDYEACSLSIGHGRDETCCAIADALAESWQLIQTWVRVMGGFLIRQVDWPETAASWLAQAKELNQERPDAIAMISSASSGIAVLKRLADQRSWSATRTFFLFSDTEDLQIYAPELAVYEGLKCLTADGKRWIVENGGLREIE